ncbi:PRR18 protein, partial [Atractosteus spatula]|nr:PRR18 protein [Atractosteus spatula]
MPVSSSGESAVRKSSKNSSRSSLVKDGVEEEIHFSLSLTPEAILVIQKRNLEKQLLAKQQKCAVPFVSSDSRHRRPLPSKRAPGAKSTAAVAKWDSHNDIRTLVKVSLLNDQYKYDDVEYEEEDCDVDETVGDEKQQVKEKKRNHGDDFLKNPKEEEDDEVKVMKQVMLDQRHLEAYRNLHRLRDAMYLHYSDLLKQKIQKQRKEMKQHGLTAHKPTEKPRGQTVSGQRLAFSTLSHDDQYLQSIPKSSFYLIVDLQNHLTKCGLLKTRQDNEEFWMLAQQYQHRAQKKIKLQDIRKIRLSPHREKAGQSFILALSKADRMGPCLPCCPGQTPLPSLPVTISTAGKEEIVHKMNTHSEKAVCEGTTHQHGKHEREQDEIEQMFPKMRYLFPSEYELRASSDKSPVRETFLPRLSHPSASVAASGGPELLANIQKDTIPPNE